MPTFELASVLVPAVISHRTVTVCPVSGALTVASRSTVAPPVCCPPDVVIVTVGATLARTVHVRDAVSVRLPLSSAVTVTFMLRCVAATAGAVRFRVHVPFVFTGVETVPRLVLAVTVIEPLASSESVTVPLIVVTDPPSTVLAAVVNAIVGAVFGAVPTVSTNDDVSVSPSSSVTVTVIVCVPVPVGVPDKVSMSVTE